MKCDGCSFEFEYVATRDGWGGGHSPFIVFNNAGAAAAAEKRARANLNRALDEAVEGVPCPACGIYQPDMVRALRKSYGKNFEPNRYAADRIAVPMLAAWQTARTINSKESYRKFMETWPFIDDHIRPGDILSPTARTFNYYAKEAVAELKYPPLVRKIGANAMWIAWGAALFVVAIAMLTR